MTPALSPWLLEAIGLALLHSLWQGAALAGVYLVFSRMSASPRARYAVALACLFALVAGLVVTTSALTPVRQSALLAVPIAADPIPLGSPSAMPAATLGAGQPIGSSVWSASPAWLAWVWIAGLGLLSLRLLADMGRVVRVVQHSRSGPRDLVEMATELGRAMGLGRLIPVRLHDALDSPVVAGWLRPLIVFPARTVEVLPTRQIRALMAHEIAHIARYDPLVNLVQSVVEVVVFFHPAAWWLSRQARDERELIADDLARTATDPETLARALAALVTPPTLAAPAATGGSMLHRIQRLLEPVRPRNPAIRTLTGAVVAATLGLVLVGDVLADGPDKRARAAGVDDPEADGCTEAYGAGLTGTELPDHASPAATRCGRMAARMGADTPDVDAITEDAVWLVEHHPAHAVHLATWDATVRGLVHRDAVTDAWSGALERHPDAPEVYRQAAIWFGATRDHDRAVALLERAVELDPFSARTRWELAEQLRSAGRADEAIAATREAEALDSDEPPYERIMAGETAVKAALETGDWDLVEQEAQALLDVVSSVDPDTWNVGNGLARAHGALGEVALRRGDAVAAAEHLTHLCDRWTPQLVSFGPDFTLAVELLDHGGHTDALSESFRECADLVGQSSDLSDGDHARVARYADFAERAEAGDPTLRDDLLQTTPTRKRSAPAEREGQ